ncbi:peptidylprolyl isomerase [Winogradskyella sp. E313]|uniref:Peptidylprolyl isomerase n=2 Tax=Winogradskyella immobilis TaxID=2816852 RepID=A0ABS8EQ81_9FLAO|nr:peptidylprolyl isomerase [Winogradskyella immobilis]
MLLKTNNSKFMIKEVALLVFALFFNFSLGQEIIKEEKKIASLNKPKSDSNRVKADGVAAVVGGNIILESDLDRSIAQIKAQGGDLGETTRCQLFGKILEDKLYAHQAVQDSITVNELQIRSQIDQQIEGILPNFNGSMADLLKYYKKNSEDELREEIYEINKSTSLANQMQEKILADIEITPEEVRQFYNNLKKEGLPTFGVELNVAEIVVIPEVTEASKQEVINKLKEYKRDIEENGASFTTKALFYSQDGSKVDGGKLPTMNRKRPRMVKEFRDVAFSLREGEISEPFESPFGYHIVFLEKIRGQEYDVRHILLRPEITQDAIEKAKKEIDEVRAKITDGSISFADAAREFSDRKETKFEGGKLINPVTQDFNFELTKMDTDIYTQIQDLKDNEISDVIQDQDRENPIFFKLVTVTDRIDEHEADFARDYLKIKRLALQNKHFDAIGKWQKETIESTFIKINGEYRDCEFTSNWLKKE